MPKKTFVDGKPKILKGNGSFNKSVGKVTDPLFQNNPFFDARDIVQVKYEMLRAVERDGQSVIQAAKAFGFSRVSYYKVLKDFKDNGFGGILPRKRGPQKAHKLTPEIMDYLSERITQNPHIAKKELVGMLKVDKGVLIHKRTLEKNLSDNKKKRRKGK